MSSIDSITDSLRSVLIDLSEQAARATGCVQRYRAFSGATLVQTLVFGWLAKPAASLHDLTQMAAVRGVSISAQALDQRFTPRLAETLRRVLAGVISHAITSDPAAVPLFERFSGIYVQRSEEHTSELQSR